MISVLATCTFAKGPVICMIFFLDYFIEETKQSKGLAIRTSKPSSSLSNSAEFAVSFVQFPRPRLAFGHQSLT